MSRPNPLMLTLALSCLAVVASASSEPIENSQYDDLVALSREFRAFLAADLDRGVPDYTPAAMAAHGRGLAEFQRRLAAVDVRGWPISGQVDYELVRAEINAADFVNRVLRPWSRDPAFYLVSQGGAGPRMQLSLGTSEPPLAADELAALRTKLRAVPDIYLQARENLNEAAGDLAVIAIHFLPDELAIYDGLLERLAPHHPELIADVQRARGAVTLFGEWLEASREGMTAPAGIGKTNYDWWMKNVQLVPYTWDELIVIMERDYKRAMAALMLEQHRNRDLPPLEPAATEEEYNRRYNFFLEYLLEFMQEEQIFTVPDYLEPRGPRPWAAFPGRLGGSSRDLFEQCEDRNPLPTPLCHEILGHDLDQRRHSRDDRPIRGANRIFAMGMMRSEGLAYALEEIFMHAGLLDEHPRAREINYILMAFRAVRAIADLRLHSNEFDLAESFEFCYEATPNHWMLADGFEVWYEMETTLRWPGWHMGMVIGKKQIMDLIADRAAQLGADFNLRETMDEFFAAGMIPIALTRWEMTGLDDEMARLR